MDIVQMTVYIRDGWINGWMDGQTFKQNHFRLSTLLDFSCLYTSSLRILVDIRMTCWSRRISDALPLP